MAINKNFVVKNGLEVNQDLILANALTKKVGIGSTNPRYNLDVRGGIGATDVIVSGIATVLNELRVGTGGTIFSVVAGPTGIAQSVGVGTANPGYLLDVRSPVSTGQTALYVQGDVRITGDLNVGDDIFFDELTARNINVTGISTLATLGVSGVTTTQYLQVTGVSTFVGFSTFNNNVYVAGISTLNGYVNIPNNLNVTGIVTAGSVSIGATQVISSARQLQNITSLDATTTATIEAAIANAPNTFTDITVSGVSTFVGLATFNNGLRVVSGVTTLGVTTATNLTLQQLNVSGLSTFAGITTVTGETLFSRQLNISGVSTLGTVQISSGIITATSGIVTYYGDGSYLTGNARNLTATIGIGTSGVAVGYGVSFLDLRGPGLSTVYYNSNVGIATIYFQGGGSGGGSASIGIGTTPGEAFTGIITAGNLWYNSNIGRLFIYYQDTDSSQWVDASPNNIGVITSLTNVSFSAGSASSPSMYFIGDTTTGFFSPGTGQFTVVSSGSSILNINSSGINVTGIITSTGGFIGNLTGNINSSGVSTLGVTSTTNLTSQTLNISGVSTLGVTSTTNLTSQTLNISGIATVGVVTASSSTAGFNLYTPLLQNYSEKINVIGNTGSACTLSLANGNYVTATLNQSTTFTFTTGMTTGAIGFALQLLNGSGGPFTITWPASVKWPNNSTPLRTTADNKTDIWVFTTIDNGTTWYGNLALYNFS